MCDQSKIREEMLKPISQHKDGVLEDICASRGTGRHLEYSEGSARSDDLFFGIRDAVDLLSLRGRRQHCEIKSGNRGEYFHHFEVYDRIAYIVGLDLNSDGQLQSTIAILDVSGSQSGSPQGNKEFSEFHTVTGNTSRHTRDKMDREISCRLSASKLRAILIGEALARQGIYPFLDVLYRDPRSALNAKVAVVAGKAHDMISTKVSGSQLISEHLHKLIQSGERRTIVPAVNLQLICPPMLDPGDDFALPYITINVPNPLVYGIALFSGDRMVSTLKSEDSLLYLLMANTRRII